MPVSMPKLPKELFGALRTTALEATALASHVLRYPTGVLSERPVEAGSGPFRGRRPVVLVHGFIDNRSVFTLLRRSLRQHDWQTVAGFNYSLLTSDIPATARDLAALVEDVCVRTGHREVDLVSHSLGGLIARYYVQRLGGHARVHTLVTLGTPHLGTSAARPLSLHPLVRQIRPGSRVLRELAEPAPDCRTRCVSFFSDLDLVMSPPETARLSREDLRVREVPVRGVGHLAMPAHWAVIARVREELLAADSAADSARSDPRMGAEVCASDEGASDEGDVSASGIA